MTRSATSSARYTKTPTRPRPAPRRNPRSNDGCQIEVKVPDIGGHGDVPVIELLVAVGDRVTKDQGLVTLESDKATMEVPSSAEGVVRELRVRVGDKVSEGAVIAVLEADVAGGGAAPAASSPAPQRDPVAAAPSTEQAEGHGGAVARHRRPHPPRRRRGRRRAAVARPTSNAACSCSAPAPAATPRRSARPTSGSTPCSSNVYASLGGVCLNVGCIPSKALLHAAAVIDEAQHAKDFGITFGTPKIELDALRTYKDKVVGQLTKGWLAWRSSARCARCRVSVASCRRTRSRCRARPARS